MSWIPYFFINWGCDNLNINTCSRFLTLFYQKWWCYPIHCNTDAKICYTNRFTNIMDVICKPFYDSVLDNRKKLNIPEMIRNMYYRCQTGFFILYCFKGCYNIFKINRIMLNSVSFLGYMKKWMCQPFEKLCNVKLKMDSVIVGDIGMLFLIKQGG